MHYIISDIHNNNERLSKLLQKISFSPNDHLFILGDLFDRSIYAPAPVDLYFAILQLGERCTVVRGNHDQQLAEYIHRYFEMPEKKRSKIPGYEYNSFELLMQRLTDVDMQDLARLISSWPLQISFELEGTTYLLAHAKTSHPNERREDDYYLNGEADDEGFLTNGIEGYISVCGHREMDRQIWKNKKGNLYVIDCGCGYKDGRLGCLCLETKEEFYV